ncbi:MAG: hypothetical protein AB7O59_06525 [Pirellulales bacterium]
MASDASTTRILGAAASSLTAADLAEIRKANEQWRDRIISARPAVEAIVGEAVWGVILEAALEPGAFERWLCSLASQISTATVPQISTAITRAYRKRSDNTTGHTGIDFHRGRYRARVQLGGQVIFNQSFDDLQSAVAAREAFQAERAA